MDGWTVSGLASRAGVPTTTLRFYEQEGLLPARRSPAGYRLYDDSAVARLAFIGAAKNLGLALPDIRGVLTPWHEGTCADVRADLAPLLERRLADTDRGIAELRTLADRLVRARDQLAATHRDGPCDASCAALGEADPAADSVPIACTLDTADRAARVDRWRKVLDAADAREPMPGGLRVTFDPARIRVGELAELAAAEIACCPFLAITLHLGPPPRLEVTAPDGARAPVHELLGDPDP